MSNPAAPSDVAPSTAAPSDAAGAPLVLTLPDGTTRTVPAGTLPREVVAGIGERLLRAAVAVTVDGQVQDLATPLRSGGAFRVLTERDPEALAVLRHSGAHVLATAVRRLRPDAKIGFGPAIDDGFYYDFEVAEPFTPEDLAAFEGEMRRVAQEKLAFERAELSRAEAQQVFRDDPLKLERLAELGEDEVISTYRDGDFVDLCRGPHVHDTGWLKHFKLLHTAAPTGAATAGASRSSASTPPRSSRRTSWSRTSSGGRRRRSATTACWAARSTCSTSSRSRRAPRSGRRAGRCCTTRWSSSCASGRRAPSRR
jgi:hypothetical protein